LKLGLKRVLHAPRVGQLVSCGALVACLTLEPSMAAAMTLLVVQPATDSLEFVDPGSGLRLASITVGSGPRRVGVSPDGRQAAVANCGTSGSAASAAITLSIVDLERPRELRRTSLPMVACPVTVTWLTQDSIALEAPAPQRALAVDASTGQARGTLSDAELEVATRLHRDRPPLDLTTLAVQQFIAGGGDPASLALTSVQPRATCHACTPEP
jgi:DNA-binding beta-propeller fold protein YncE